MTRIAILGGGPGGYEAALVAAQLGAEVLVVDRDGLGGACVVAAVEVAAAESGEEEDGDEYEQKGRWDRTIEGK